jgi:NAD(P)-dependent dehydrogenase (short-subunit alcohol dehydrogenase family)
MVPNAARKAVRTPLFLDTHAPTAGAKHRRSQRVYATMHCCQAVLPGMKEPQATARIVSIISEAGRSLVAWGGIEPPTRGFSIRCSTN